MIKPFEIISGLHIFIALNFKDMTNLKQSPIFIKGILMEGYMIFEDGIIRSYKWGREMIIKPRISTSGYPKVTLWCKNKPYHNFVHRIMAEMFLTNPENKRCVNHIDGDKFNNHLSNLEWITDSENQKHSHANGLHRGMKGEYNNSAKLTTQQVLDIRQLRKTQTGVSLSKKYGVSENTIRDIYYKRRWTHI